MHSLPRALLVALVAVALVACNRADARRPAGDGAARGAPATAPADPCPGIRARYAATLSGASGRCTTAAECACYAPVAGGCGGVTDSATQARLAPIEREFHAAQCQYTSQCAAWVCAPRCDQGRCSQ